MISANLLEEAKFNKFPPRGSRRNSCRMLADNLDKDNKHGKRAD